MQQLKPSQGMMITPAEAVVPPDHAAGFNTVWNDIPPCPTCPRRALRGTTETPPSGAPSSVSANSSFAGEGACTCHCRTCFHLLSPPCCPATAPLPRDSFANGSFFNLPGRSANQSLCSANASFASQKSTSLPGPRCGHTLTPWPGQAAGQQQYLLFGGTTYIACFNDVWRLDGAAGTFVPLSEQLQLQGGDVPSPRFGHSCHAGKDGGHLVLFGGSTDQAWFNDLFTLRSSPDLFHSSMAAAARPSSVGAGAVAFKPWPRRSASDPWPCARRSHTFSHYKGTTSVLYGGFCRVSLHDVWLLDLDAEDGATDAAAGSPPPLLQWRELQTVGNDPSCPDARCPESRYCHASAVTGDSLLTFGGYCAGALAAPVTWRLSLITGVWEAVQVQGAIPRARFGHASVAVPGGSQGLPAIVIFGGLSRYPHGAALADCFAFSAERQAWTELTSSLVTEKLTESRKRGKTPGDAKRGVVVFGGWSDPNGSTHETSFTLVWAPSFELETPTPLL